MANTKVTGDLIASSTIATGNIADNAVTSDKISGITTAHITEGSNLYYTNARARGAVSVSGNALSYNSSTGVITSNFEESPSFSGNVGIGVTPHGTASLNITNTAQHIRLNNGSELGIITLDTDGKLDLWAHGTGETINFRTGTGSGTVTMSVVGSNVGIGTTSPSSYDGESDDLVVFNSTTPGITIATDDTASRGALRFADGTSGNERYRGAVEYNHNGDDMSFRTAGTQKMTLTDAGNLLITSGNVGIGTTSPSKKLVVAQSNVTEPSGIDANTGILIKNNTWSGIQIISTEATGGFLTFGDNAAGFAGRIQYLHATDNMVFETAAAEKMRIESDGILSIGEGATQSWINNKAQVTTTAVAGVNLTNIDRTAANLIRFTNPQYSTSAQVGLLLRVFPNSDARQGAGLLMTGGSDNAASNLSLFVSKDDGTSSNVSQSYSALHIAGNTGNIGIGTISPNGKLNISNGGANGLEIDPTQSSGAATLLQSYNRSGSAYTLMRMNAGSYEFQIADSTKITINSSGQVGIGTTSPSSYNSRGRNLVLSGSNDVGISINSSNTNSGSIVFADGTGGTAGYRGVIEYYHGDDGMRFFTSASEKMRIDSSGNLSLATATSLNFNVSDATFITAKESMVLVIDSDNNQTGRVFQIKSNGVNGDVLFSLGDNGQLGLGTTGPSERLHVEGRIRLGSTPVICSHDNVGIDIDQNNNSGSNYFRVTRDGEATELFRIQESGKTLIGITTEQNAGKLQIQSGGYENGGILDIVTGGWYRYYTRVCHNATSASAAGYWHIKTNIVVNSNTMFMAKFYGYIYGSAQILDLTHAGYAYSGTNSVINQATTNNGNNTNASSAIYASSNGNKVTFRIAFGTGTNFSTYFCGVMMDMAFPSPAGQNIDFEIEAQTFSTNTTVY